ncbi:hypothetical protein E2C01_026075 [Portunus trituberculatus]|uniref:Uncharacterized protein n=1 Tax=Portunus trituberculatus TaxID=210409 RepID=A0A5B7EHP8_PORTR|nr:hypothetical protein [Portunus trituberculatus]
MYDSSQMPGRGQSAVRAVAGNVSQWGGWYDNMGRKNRHRTVKAKCITKRIPMEGMVLTCNIVSGNVVPSQVFIQCLNNGQWHFDGLAMVSSCMMSFTLMIATHTTDNW